MLMHGDGAHTAFGSAAVLWLQPGALKELLGEIIDINLPLGTE